MLNIKLKKYYFLYKSDCFFNADFFLIASSSKNENIIGLIIEFIGINIIIVRI